MQHIDEYAATKVRGLLAERRARQADVASVLNLDASSLSRRLGGRRPFAVAELAALAEHFDVPLATFFPAETAAVSA